MVIWKTIENYPNYKISNNGLVMSIKTGKIMKGTLKKSGYLQIDLWNNGTISWFLIHRLVALSFIPNPDNKPQVNHIDEDKQNNNINNLEWVTAKENMNYGTRNIRAGLSNGKEIYALYPDGTDEYYPSASDAGRHLNLNASNITSVLRGRLKTTGGLKFEYAEEIK